MVNDASFRDVNGRLCPWFTCSFGDCTSENREYVEKHLCRGNGTHEERQAWDRYACAALATALLTGGNAYSIGSEVADAMLAERRKRFGGGK